MSSSMVLVAAPELVAMVRAAVREELASRSGVEVNEWLDASQVASLLSVHPRTVQKLVRLRGLPASRVGKLYRFQRGAVERWASEQVALGRRRAP